MMHKSGFIRLFVGGFLAGVAGVIALQPIAATRTLGEHLHLSATR